MSIREWLRLPTRVSRVYPVLALALMVLSSTLIYSWKYTQINSDVAVTSRDREITSLKQQVDQLQTQQKNDKAALAAQQKQLTDSSAQLKSQGDELAQKEAALAQAQEQLKNQQDQLSANAAELEKLRSRPPLFSFQNQSTLADIDQKEADIKNLVSNAYTYIQNIYGAPYLLNGITITFVDNFTITGASGEIVIDNGPNGISVDIHLKDFDKNSFTDNNTVIHEMIHAFHGIAVLDSSAMEEGITVAATDAVMANMIKDGKLPNFSPLYLTLTNAQYQQWNKTLNVAADSTTFYSYPDVAKVYQLIGQAWMNLYKEDPNFFLEFNSSYYPKVQKGLSPDEALVRDTIKSIVKSVQGQPIDTYLATNRAFNPS